MKKFILAIFLFLFLAGFVLAVDEGELGNCCIETTNGLHCQPVASNTNLCSNPDPRSCDNIDECNTFGDCYDSNTGLCSPNTIQLNCQDSGETWGQNLLQCEDVCCMVNEEKFPSTRGYCDYYANSIGAEAEMSTSSGDADCITYSEARGACLLDEPVDGRRNCKITTQHECDNLGHRDEFYEGYLCSHEGLNTICEATQTTGCADENVLATYPDVYWYDSCGNMENVYLGNSPDKKIESWALGYIKSRNAFTDSQCLYGDCGLCDYNTDTGMGTQICSTESGRAKCNSIACENVLTGFHYDSSGNKVKDIGTKQSGERWCIYENPVGGVSGISVDPPGSEHYRGECIYGKVYYDACGEGRDHVCYEENSQADCRKNLGWECFDVESKELCEFLPDCRVQTVSVGDIDQAADTEERDCFEYTSGAPFNCRDENHFQFQTCVPRYPFSADNEEENKDLCSLGTVTGKTTWGKEEAKDVFRVNNAMLSTPTGAKGLNDLCVSIGDCGAYPNYIGKASSSANQQFETTKNRKNIWWGGILYYKFKMEANPANWEDYLGLILGNSGGDVPKKVPDESADQSFSDSLRRYNENTHASETGSGLCGGTGCYNDNVRVSENTLTCKPWQRPFGIGESYCNECNNNFGLPCTKYKCESLGESCELIPTDQVEGDEPICYDTYNCNPGTQQEAEISFEEMQGNPNFIDGGNSVEILDCITEGKTINFTISTNKKTKCKLFYDTQSIINGFSDPDEYENYDEDYDQDAHIKEAEDKGLFSDKHTFVFSAPPFDQGTDVTYYVSCIDICDTPNVDPYYQFNFCVSKTIDFTAPNIEEYTPPHNSYLAFNQDEIELKLRLSKPGTCKYSSTPDKLFTEMENTMTCNTDSRDFREWTCTTTLEGLNQEENNIYIKCNNTDGHFHDRDNVYTLLASQDELKINSVELITDIDTLNPNHEGVVIQDSSFKIKAVTSGGATGDGSSTCQNKLLGIRNSYGFNTFGERGGITHESSVLTPPADIYSLIIKCNDSAGNYAQNISHFTLRLDEEPPVVTRAYLDGSNLVLWTNEESICYYNFTGCGFDTETSAPFGGATYDKKHTLSVADNVKDTYYIRCEDRRENINRVNSCAIVVRPLELRE